MENNGKNILVTGGAGYIGSHFVNLMRKQEGAKIFVVDNFSQSRSNILKDEKVKYFEVDLRDKPKLGEVFKDNNIDSVVHFAALALIPESVGNPQTTYDNNLTGGLNLLACMLDSGVKKIIFSSSASVYGETNVEVVSEDHPKNPTNPYGYTKLAFEHILQDYHKAYNIDSVSFRYFCAAGCDESLEVGEYHNPETHVIPCILETILDKRKEFFVYGKDYNTPDGTGIRDYIHVNDLASAHVAAVEKLVKNDNICTAYNLGINKGFSVLELVAAAEKVTGKKVNYKFADRRPGDLSRLIANASKAMEELNWQPKHTEIEGIISSCYNSFKGRQ